MLALVDANYMFIYVDVDAYGADSYAYAGVFHECTGAVQMYKWCFYAQ